MKKLRRSLASVLWGIADPIRIAGNYVANGRRPPRDPVETGWEIHLAVWCSEEELDKMEEALVEILCGCRDNRWCVRDSFLSSNKLDWKPVEDEDAL